jgi:arylformamidase
MHPRMQLTYRAKDYTFDITQPLDISMVLDPEGEQANCYWAEPFRARVIRSGDFVGSVAEGGSVNYRQLSLTPHGNGTHTECYGHISAERGATLNHCLDKFLHVAQLVTLTPAVQDGGDKIVSLEDFKNATDIVLPEAIIIRTLPNDADKRTRQYSGTNPPYLEAALATHLAASGVKHLLIDLPSLDREEDGGILKAHHQFWLYPEATRTDCTITELIYVPDYVPDGLYMLQMQVLNLAMDASPSRPVLYALTEL